MKNTVNDIVMGLYRMLYEYGRDNDLYLADVGVFLEDNKIRFILRGRSKDKVDGKYIEYDFDWLFTPYKLFCQWYDWKVEDENEE